MRAVSLRGGGTDCAIPVVYAIGKKLAVDAIVQYTDNETWRGAVHPAQAMQRYRRESGKVDARLVSVGMVSNGFTIADPSDPFMLDVVGFDASAPQVISNFVAGEM
jgi:60 kDa SS-A/Ro ribonucleoprotein